MFSPDNNKHLFSQKERHLKGGDHIAAGLASLDHFYPDFTAAMRKYEQAIKKTFLPSGGIFCRLVQKQPVTFILCPFRPLDGSISHTLGLYILSVRSEFIL